MQPLVPFSLPISGLRDELHTFRFEVDEEFFKCFEGSVIQQGKFEVLLDLDKRPNLMVLHFRFKGAVRVECDRCLEAFDLPIEDEQDLVVKYDIEPREDAEVIYILRETPSLDVAKFVYEFIHLALPMYATHDQAGLACDPEMLKYIQQSEPHEEDDQPDSPWSELENWNDN